jgi:hypothetical protein
MKKGKPFFIASQPVFPERPGKSRLPEPLLRLKGQILEFYNKFKERFDPQEIVCSTLRFAEEITILHPESMGKDEAETKLSKFLSKSGKKHLVWLWIDGILAMMGGILTPLPGPNLFFFYPAARAISHYFAGKGVDTAKSLGRKTFTANPLLDTIQENITSLESVNAEIEKLENVSGCGHIQRLLSLP